MTVTSLGRSLNSDLTAVEKKQNIGRPCTADQIGGKPNTNYTSYHLLHQSFCRVCIMKWCVCFDFIGFPNHCDRSSPVFVSSVLCLSEHRMQNVALSIGSWY